MMLPAKEVEERIVRVSVVLLPPKDKVPLPDPKSPTVKLLPFV